MPFFFTLFYLEDSTFILYFNLSLSDESNYRLICPKKITLTGPYMYMTVLVMKVWIQLTVSIVCCVFFSAMIATWIVRMKHKTNYFTVNTSMYKMRVKVHMLSRLSISTWHGRNSYFFHKFQCYHTCSSYNCLQVCNQFDKSMEFDITMQHLFRLIKNNRHKVYDKTTKNTLLIFNTL